MINQALRFEYHLPSPLPGAIGEIDIFPVCRSKKRIHAAEFQPLFTAEGSRTAERPERRSRFAILRLCVYQHPLLKLSRRFSSRLLPDDLHTAHGKHLFVFKMPAQGSYK